MDIVTVLSAFAVSALVVRYGLLKKSFIVKLKNKETFEAVFERRSLLIWELLITIKGESVGIKQGTGSLPYLSKKAKEFDDGKSPLLPR